MTFCGVALSYYPVRCACKCCTVSWKCSECGKRKPVSRFRSVGAGRLPRKIAKICRSCAMLSDANLSLCSLGSGQQSPCVRIPAHCLAGHKSMNVLSGSVLVAKAMIKTNALNDWMFRDFLNDKDISQAIFSLPSGGLTF